jgi:hypothetical protein
MLVVPSGESLLRHLQVDIGIVDIRIPQVAPLVIPLLLLASGGFHTNSIVLALFAIVAPISHESHEPNGTGNRFRVQRVGMIVERSSIVSDQSGIPAS